MVEQSQTVLELPTKTGFASTDKVVFVANWNESANTGNVALIPIGTVLSGYVGSIGVHAKGYTGSVGYTGSQGVGYTGSVGGSSASGTFTTADNKTITVTNGVITAIESI